MKKLFKNLISYTVILSFLYANSLYAYPSAMPVRRGAFINNSIFFSTAFSTGIHKLAFVYSLLKNGIVNLGQLDEARMLFSGILGNDANGITIIYNKGVKELFLYSIAKDKIIQIFENRHTDLGREGRKDSAIGGLKIYEYPYTKARIENIEALGNNQVVQALDTSSLSSADVVKIAKKRIAELEAEGNPALSPYLGELEKIIKSNEQPLRESSKPQRILSKSSAETTEQNNLSKAPFLHLDLVLSVLYGLVAVFAVWRIFYPVGLAVLLSTVPHTMPVLILFLSLSLFSVWLGHEVLGHFIGGRILKKYLMRYGYPDVKLRFHWLWTEIESTQRVESLSEDQKTKLETFKRISASLGPIMNLFIFAAGLMSIFTISTPLYLLATIYILVSNLSGFITSMIPVGTIPIPLASSLRRLSGAQSDGGIIFGKKLLNRSLLEDEIRYALKYNLEENLPPSITRPKLLKLLSGEYRYLKVKGQRDIFHSVLDRMISSGDVIRLHFSGVLILKDDVPVLRDKSVITMLNPDIIGREMPQTAYFLSSRRQEGIKNGNIIEVFTYRPLSKAQKSKHSKDEIAQVLETAIRVYFTPERYSKLKDTAKVVEIGEGETVLRISHNLQGAIGIKSKIMEKIMLYCASNNMMDEFLFILDVIVIFKSLPEKLKKQFANFGLMRYVFLLSLLPEQKRGTEYPILNPLINRLNQLREIHFDITDRDVFSLYYQFMQELIENEPQSAIFLFPITFGSMLAQENRGLDSDASKILYNKVVLVFKPLFAKHFGINITTDVIDKGFKAVQPAIYDNTKERINNYIKKIKEGLFNKFSPNNHNLIKLANVIKNKIEKGLSNRLSRQILDNIELEITSRQKGVWSTYDKVRRYNKTKRKKGKGEFIIEDIHDLLAFRIIVKGEGLSEEQKKQVCSGILEVLKGKEFPIDYIEDESDDYIAKPRKSGYQALNTIWKIGENKFEIQIKTDEMHKIAEYGPASHSEYKVKEVIGSDFTEYSTSMSVAYMDMPKKGQGTYKLVRLPKGATVLDLLSHPDVDRAGNIIIGRIKVGRKIGIISLKINRQLQAGDIIKFKCGKRRKRPVSVKEKNRTRHKLYRSRLFMKTLDTKGKWKQGLKMLIKIKYPETAPLIKEENINEKLLKKLGIDPQQIVKAAVDYGFTTQNAKRDFENKGIIEPCFPAVEELLTAVSFDVVKTEDVLKYLEPDMPAGHNGFEALALKEGNAGYGRNISKSIYDESGNRVRIVKSADNIRDFLFGNKTVENMSESGIMLYLDKDLLGGLKDAGIGKRDFIKLFEYVLNEIPEELKPNIGFDKKIAVGIVDTSPNLFLDCRRNGFIGINRIFLDILRKDQSPEKVVSKMLLILGLHHELFHEGIVNEESFSRQEGISGNLEDWLLAEGENLYKGLLKRYATQNYNKYNMIRELKRMLAGVIQNNSAFLNGLDNLKTDVITEKLIDAVEAVKGIKREDILKSKLERIVNKLLKGERVELTEEQVYRLLLLIHKSGDIGLVSEIAEFVNTLLEENYIGRRGEAVMAIEEAVLSWLDTEKQFAEQREKKRAETLKKGIRKKISKAKQNVIIVRRTFRGIRIDSGISIPENVRNAIEYIDRYKAPLPETDSKEYHYVLIDKYRAKRYKEIIGEISEQWKVKFLTDISDMPKDVNIKDIVVLLDPEDADKKQWQNKSFRWYLPLIYTKKSLILAAWMSINKPERLAGTPIYEFIKGFYKSLGIGDVTEEQVAEWIQFPWLLKDKIESLTANLQMIRSAFEQLDTSA